MAELSKVCDICLSFAKAKVYARIDDREIDDGGEVINQLVEATLDSGYEDGLFSDSGDSKPPAMFCNEPFLIKHWEDGFHAGQEQFSDEIYLSEHPEEENAYPYLYD